MKKLIVSMLVALYATATFAQSSLLATLSHEGNITTYYGTNALKEAYDAAVNGDIITLSSGKFNAVDIKKAITVRGAGMAEDKATGILPTIITGNFSITISENVNQGCILEGLYNNELVSYYTGNEDINNVKVIKCHFRRIESSTWKGKISLSIIQSRLRSISVGDNTKLTCLNSYIRSPYCCSKETSNIEMQNCVVFFNTAQDVFVYSSVFTNCILFQNADIALAPSVMAHHCLAVGDYTASMFNNIPVSMNTNKIANGFGMFTDEIVDNWVTESNLLELTDEASKEYLGNDGTQVGMYGGLMPFTIIPTGPRITQFKVADKSTADGKLSVDIHVSIAE